VAIFATYVNSIGSAVTIFSALYFSTILHFSVEHVAYIPLTRQDANNGEFRI
jgi:hypothetical protein